MAGKQSREVIGGKRACGKSTELIKRAHEERLYILCPNRDMAKMTFNMANDMGLDIPYPVTVDELPLRSPHINEILIDEVEMVLQQLIGKPVVAMSTSYELNEFPSLREEVSATKESKSVGIFHVDIDCSNALKGLKAVQREARSTAKELKEVESLTKDKYLVIALNELGDAPKVIYKGKEITLKEFVNFKWTTDTDVKGSTDIIVDYFERDNDITKSKTIREGVRL